MKIRLAVTKLKLEKAAINDASPLKAVTANLNHFGAMQHQDSGLLARYPSYHKLSWSGQKILIFSAPYFLRMNF